MCTENFGEQDQQAPIVEEVKEFGQIETQSLLDHEMTDTAPLDDLRRRLKELKAKTGCRACGRKGHWANDLECAMYSSSSSTQTIRHVQPVWRHDNNFPTKRYNDDPYIAKLVGQNRTEATEQIPLTPTASAAIDIKNTATFDDRAMDDNDEPWATEADNRTGWNKTFKIGTYRGMLYGIVLRDCP